MQLDEPKMLFVDLFCGAGGTTTGIEHAKIFDKKAAKVIACVNHDKNAIVSHQQNHPHCLHFTEDIRTLELTPLITVSRYAKRQYPSAKLFMWASLECTEYSKAKGGLARDADSRTLAEHLFRYIDAIDFDGILIENVEEFQAWGPMRIKPKSFHATFTELTLIKDKKTKKIKYGYEPLPERRGEYYKTWVTKMSSIGYRFDSKILNAADYGAYTSRKRYFGAFVRHSVPISWPIPTHTRRSDSGLPQWKPVKEVLDLHLFGENIFERKKPLAEATLERIYEGLLKFGGSGDNSFISYYYGNGYNSSINVPAGTVTTKDRMTLVQFLLFPQWGPKCAHSIEKPSPVLPARMDKMCPYIINAEKANANISINKLDSPFTKKIKQYMIDNGVAEVRMRGLSIDELKRITGFETWYVLVGTIAEIKKYIGNAVPVRLAQAIIESFAASLDDPYEQQQKVA